MNDNINIIPKDFIPIKKITICSNVIMNLDYFINHNGFFPLLIGQGEIPKIWLNIIKNDKIIKLIDNNISQHKEIAINVDVEQKSILITYKEANIDILKLNYADNNVEIVQLDLRPIGYVVFGDTEQLNVGTNVFKNNTIEANFVIDIK